MLRHMGASFARGAMRSGGTVVVIATQGQARRAILYLSGNPERARANVQRRRRSAEANVTITDGADDILALNTMTTSVFSHYAGNIFKSESFVFPVTVTLDETAMKLNNATIPLTPGVTVAVEIRPDSRREG
jgi:hypothetical protein